MAPTIRGLGNVKPHVRAAAEEIASRFGIYNIGGFATSGHATNSDHYTGHAIDVMTGANPNAGKGELIAQWTLANANRLGVKYIIWNRRITNLDSRGWRSYSGVSPHTDHVHISFNTAPGDGSEPVETGASTSGTNDFAGCLGQLFGFKVGE